MSILAMFGDFCKGGSQVGYILSIWRLEKVPIFLAPDHFSQPISGHSAFRVGLPWCESMPPTDLYPQNTIVRVLRTDQSFFCFFGTRGFSLVSDKKNEKSIFRTESGNYGLWPLRHLKGPFKGSLWHLQLLERPPEKKVTIDFFFRFLGQNPKTHLKKFENVEEYFYILMYVESPIFFVSFTGRLWKGITFFYCF